MLCVEKTALLVTLYHSMDGMAPKGDIVHWGLGTLLLTLMQLWLLLSQMQAAVSEYCAATDAAGVAPPAYLQILSVDLLLQQEQHYQAVQLLYSQPNSGSAILAQHLLEVAGKDIAAAAAAGGAASGGSILAGLSGGVSNNLGFRGSGGSGVLDHASPVSAMAFELALDVMSRQAVPELRPSSSTAAGSSSGLAGSGDMAATSRASTAAYVRQLLGLGQVLQAARVARTAGGVAAVQVPARDFLEVAAASGDVGAFAAIYRVMRPHLVGMWPDYESARSHFWGGTAVQG